jgi:hypothetical protein
LIGEVIIGQQFWYYGGCGVHGAELSFRGKQWK